MKKHPCPVERIVEIVKRLYAFERLRVSELSQRYEVSERTIRRDIEKIAEVVPIVKKRGVFHLDMDATHETRKLERLLIGAFATNAGISLDCLEESKREIPLITFAVAYGGLNETIAEGIIESIEKGCRCGFVYTNNRGETDRRDVSPLRLYTAKGKWYLLAKDRKDGAIKIFDFLKIRSFQTLPNLRSEVTETDKEAAAKRPSVWSSSDSEPFEVRLYASAHAARYLKEVPLHPSQRLDMPHSDGTAEFLYTVTHPMELLPEIKNWIPHVHVIEPAWLRDELRKDVEDFLKEMREMDI